MNRSHTFVVKEGGSANTAYILAEPDAGFVEVKIETSGDMAATQKLASYLNDAVKRMVVNK